VFPASNRRRGGPHPANQNDLVNAGCVDQSGYLFHSQLKEHDRRNKKAGRRTARQ
jgi:hypothetical protein